MSDGDCSYLNPMTWNIKEGMAFVLSNWGPDNTSWIEHGTCTRPDAGCDRVSTLSTFKNLRFSTADAIAPPVDYETYQFGFACTAEENEADGSECDAMCSNCHKSWPADDPLK